MSRIVDDVGGRVRELLADLGVTAPPTRRSPVSRTSAGTTIKLVTDAQLQRQEQSQ